MLLFWISQYLISQVMLKVSLVSSENFWATAKKTHIFAAAAWLDTCT